MYIPRHFKESEWREISAFLEKYAFATVVTTMEGKPVATHLPLQLHEDNGAYYLTGHFAYANPQWKTFRENDQQVLLIFQGPHAYVSSSWYKEEEVSTWNYQSVHIYGTGTLLTVDELENDLILLMKKYEQHRENPVLWENLSDKTKKQIKGIVGFKVKVEEVQAAYKLSQNRGEEDYQNIINKLSEEDEPNAQSVGEIMKKRK